jgi:ATP-dependent protease ClpP protease subunit
MDIFIYSEIQPGLAESVRAQLATLGESEELNIRINSPGGSVTEGFAVASFYGYSNSLKRLYSQYGRWWPVYGA